MKIQLILFLIFCSLISTAQEELNSEVLHPLEVYDNGTTLNLHEVIDIIELDDGFIYINNVHTNGFQPQLDFQESYIKKTDPFLNIIDSIDTQTLGLEIPGLILWGLTQDSQNDSLLHVWAGAEDNTLLNGRMKDFFVLHLNLDLEILSIDSFSYLESFQIRPPTVNHQGNITTLLRSYVEDDSMPYSRSYVEISTEGEILNIEAVSIFGISSQLAQLPDHSYLSPNSTNRINYYDQTLNRTSGEQYADLIGANCEAFLNTVTIDSTVYFGTACELQITLDPNVSWPWSPIIEYRYVEQIYRFQNGEITQVFEEGPYPLAEDASSVFGYAVDFNALKFNFDALYSDRFYTSAFYDNFFINQITHRLSLHASDENGNLRWSKHFSHPTKSYETYRVKALKDGGVLLLAEFNNRNPDISIEKDVVFMRFDENGNEYTGEVTNIDELEMSSLVLYPNPAKERLSIQIESGHSIKALAVYSLDGKRLIHQTGSSNSVDLNHLTKGMYILSVSFSDGIVVREKFIKQ